ncbi:hypothetical protein QN277_018016 [Acacia crassicarpa]|nr:hypothetical protein QN277_018016 [Acacia crassicarpa]
MLLASTSFSFSLSQRTQLLSSLSLRGPIHDAVNAPNIACGRRFSYGNLGGRLAIQASKEDHSIQSIQNVIFEPFEEVKKNLHVISTEPQASLARQHYNERCEAALNEQINVEYSISYVYHAMHAYFDRDNIALRGLAKFFKDSSEEERQHAEKLMKYQNIRGGRVKLQSLLMPLSNYDHTEKGDALNAMELALSLEKLNNEKLLNLHKLASKNNDTQFTDFIEGEFLADQVESIKKISEYVAQLRRVGKGHGVWHFDQMLINEAAAQ